MVERSIQLAAQGGGKQRLAKRPAHPWTKHHPRDPKQDNCPNDRNGFQNDRIKVHTRNSLSGNPRQPHQTHTLGIAGDNLGILVVAKLSRLHFLVICHFQYTFSIDLM